MFLHRTMTHAKTYQIATMTKCLQFTNIPSFSTIRFDFGHQISQHCCWVHTVQILFQSSVELPHSFETL